MEGVGTEEPLLINESSTPCAAGLAPYKPESLVDRVHIYPDRVYISFRCTIHFFLMLVLIDS